MLCNCGGHQPSGWGDVTEQPDSTPDLHKPSGTNHSRVRIRVVPPREQPPSSAVAPASDAAGQQAPDDEENDDSMRGHPPSPHSQIAIEDDDSDYTNTSDSEEAQNREDVHYWIVPNQRWQEQERERTDQWTADEWESHQAWMESGNERQAQWRERQLAMEQAQRDQSWTDYDEERSRRLPTSYEETSWTTAPPSHPYVRATRRRVELPSSPWAPDNPRPDVDNDDQSGDGVHGEPVDGEQFYSPLEDDQAPQRPSPDRPRSGRRGQPRAGRRPIPASHPRAKAVAAAVAATLPRSAAGFSMCQEQRYTTELLALIGFIAIIGLIYYLYLRVKRQLTEIVNQQPAVAVPLLPPTTTVTTEECHTCEQSGESSSGELRHRQPATTNDREVDRVYFSSQATQRERSYHFDRDCRGLRPAKQVCSAKACKLCVKSTPPHLACRMPCQHPTCVPDPPRRLQHSGMRCGLHHSHWNTGVECNCGNHEWT